MNKNELENALFKTSSALKSEGAKYLHRMLENSSTIEPIEGKVIQLAKHPVLKKFVRAYSQFLQTNSDSPLSKHSDFKLIPSSIMSKPGLTSTGLVFHSYHMRDAPTHKAKNHSDGIIKVNWRLHNVVAPSLERQWM